MHVKKHESFQREGHNLVMTLDVKLTDALLGGEYAVKTLDGDITLKVPAGTAHGEILRVRGKGVPIDSGRRGDLLVKLNIRMPAKLSRKARKIVEDLRAEGV